MKRLLISTSIFATAYAMAATFDLADYSTTSGVNWKPESTWTHTGDATEVYPTENDDIVFSNGGNYDANGTTLYVTGDTTVKSLTFDLYGTDHFYITIDKDSSLTVKEDSLIDSCRKSWNQTQFSGGSNSSLTFEKGLTITDTNSNGQKVIVALGSAGSGELENFTVGNNLDIVKTTNSTFEVYFASKKISIGGVVNIGCNDLNLIRRTKNISTEISFGGVNGTGKISLGYRGETKSDLDGDGAKDDVTYTYKNYSADITVGSNNIASASWSGTIDKSSAGTTNAASTINITKVGSSVQEFRVANLKKQTGVNNTVDNVKVFTDAEQYAINNLKVTAGTFVYGAGEGVLSGVLRNIAGTFKVGGVAAAEEGVMDVGTVNFASGEWVGGTIALDVDMSIGINDALNFNGTFNAASAKSDETASSRVLYIDFNSELMAELIESEGSYIAENLISYDSTNLTADDFVIKGVEGYDYEAVIGENGLGVIITAAVPEPADIAILIGAVALGFVAYRRRK